jgi:hypothetical protein
MDVSQVLLVVGAVVLIVVAVVARGWMRQKVYQQMNQPGKKKSAIQKFFGW